MSGMKVRETNRANKLIKQLKVMDGVRTGIHVSDLLYCLRKTYFRRVNEIPITDRMQLLFAIGKAMHNYLHPGQGEQSVEVDGILCSPDNTEDKSEIKTTRSNSDKFNPSDMPKWERQMMAYCKALGVKVYNLDAFFICGNYKPPFPTLRTFEYTFTEGEIESNWQWLKARRDILVKALETDTPPAKDCEEWECKECEAIGYCSALSATMGTISD